MDTNVLYDGDNRCVAGRAEMTRILSAVDLVELDPQVATDAQLLAFEDTWHA